MLGWTNSVGHGGKLCKRMNYSYVFQIKKCMMSNLKSKPCTLVTYTVIIKVFNAEKKVWNYILEVDRYS